ncbi:MAG: PEP/pyruvate-binding domain-containing protein, partial [Prochlorothrix sp.]
MQPFLWLDHLQRTDQNTVGIKALALGQLRQMGFAVPNGFVIPASRCQAFLGEVTGSSPLLMDFPNSTLWLDVDDGLQLRQVACALQTALREQSWPQDWIEALGEALETLNSPMVILRPCGVITSESQSQWYSWPRSLHRSARPPDRSGRPGDAPGGHALRQAQTQRRPGLSGAETDILKMVAIEAQVCPGSVESCVAQIKQIWAALFRATSLLCWHRHDIPLESVGVAVLVQGLQRPALTGTLTLEQQEDRLEVQIQACQGLGFALTRGEVLPDRYHWQGGVVATAGLGAVELGAVGEPIALAGKITGQRLGHQSFGYRFYDPTGDLGLGSGRAKVVDPADLGATVTEAVVTDVMGANSALEEAVGSDSAAIDHAVTDAKGLDSAGQGAVG